MKTEEAHLVEACKKKDRRAYRELYDRFSPQMYAICLRYTHSQNAAEDVLHDAFIKVIDSLHRIKNSDSLKSFINSITVHTAINAYRDQPFVVDPDSVSEIVEDDFGPESLYSSIDIQYILEAIRQLPSRYQLVFNLCEIEGYSFAEVAKQLNIQESSVRSNLLRAKRILAEKLKPHI